MSDEVSRDDAEAGATDDTGASFPIVGMGASAGGLEALTEFFDHLPADPGMAFVVITHQHPGHTSLLPELLGRHTSLAIEVVGETAEVRRNTIYMPRPGAQLGMLRRELVTMQPEPRGPQLPVDHFFRSLADDQKERAIGIVLSGTGTDGTSGLKAIKGAGGMVMAQAEGSARFGGMPGSAIATHVVDYVLPVAEMPVRLLAYARGAYVAGRSALELDAERTTAVLQQVLLLLRKRTGHDFSAYKPTTIRRRIERRMSVHHLDEPNDYVLLLQRQPHELDLLFKELLIGVTSFFRDPDAFASLETALVALLRDKPEDYVVRAWVPGCSTGEEAYSLAILLREVMEQIKRFFSLQIFATDLDADAINVARAAVYPDGIAGDVSPRRLERFFVRQDQRYRIKKEVREMLVFAPQNVIGDPPFSKLDLLSCRNLLIYLDGSLQRRLLPIFHYALRSDGILFLGTSESVGGFQQLFSAIDKKYKIYRRREVTPGSYAAEVPPVVAGHLAGKAPALRPSAPASELKLAQLAERVMLRELLPPCVLVRERGDIVHIHGRTGLFLEPSPGPQPVANIFNMAREGLQLHLASAIRQASTTQEEVVRRDVRVKSNGEHSLINLRVVPISQPETMRGMLLVCFELIVDADSVVDATEELSAGESQQLAELARELAHTKECHQSTIEELETANEELKSTNEELQSTNEELQSANEELETSKEEMQSLNEELQMVNSELQGKVEELMRASDDMNNLLNSTDIATIFLDNDLNIKRFTEQATSVIRLIPSDAGRPLGDLVSELRYDRLVEDAQEVLNTLVAKQVELCSKSDVWYLMRILPYRTAENVIDGLVVSFVDITTIKGLQSRADSVLRVLGDSPVTIFAQDEDLRVVWSAGGRLFGWGSDAVIGKTDTELVGEDDARTMVAIKRQVQADDVPHRDVVHVTMDGRAVDFDLYVVPWMDAGGTRRGVLCVCTALEGAGKG